MASTSPLIPLLFFGLIGLGIFSSLYNLRQRYKAWRAFAHRHGLSLAPSRQHISGTYEGQQLELKVEQRGSGNNRRSVTVLLLGVSDVVSRSLFLEREGLGDKFLKLFGRPDEELGDDEFDRYFDLKNLDPESATLLRHPEVRHQLFTVAKTYRVFAIRQGQLLVETYGVPSSLEALESFIQPALVLVRTLKSANQGPSRRRATS
jgi:hypothetical protein